MSFCGERNELICSNNGTCIDNACVCRMPFTGANCTEEICELLVVFSVCVRIYTCTVCMQFDNVQLLFLVCVCVCVCARCYSIPGDPVCQNNRSCYNGFCSCGSLFSGTSCENGAPHCSLVLTVCGVLYLCSCLPSLSLPSLPRNWSLSYRCTMWQQQVLLQWWQLCQWKLCMYGLVYRRLLPVHGL